MWIRESGRKHEVVPDGSAQTQSFAKQIGRVKKLKKDLQNSDEYSMILYVVLKVCVNKISSDGTEKFTYSSIAQW